VQLGQRFGRDVFPLDTVSTKALLGTCGSMDAHPRVRCDEFFGLAFGAGAGELFAKTALVFGVFVIVVVS